MTSSKGSLLQVFRMEVRGDRHSEQRRLSGLTSLHEVQLLSFSLLRSSCKCIALKSIWQSFSSRSTSAFLLQMSWDFPPCSLKMAFCLVQLLVLAKKISTSTSAHVLCCGLFHFSSTDIYPSHTNICNTQVITLILEFHCEVFSDNSSCRLEKLRTSQPTIMLPFEQQLHAEGSVVAMAFYGVGG